MSTKHEKISVIEKIGYSLGDLAANLIFQTLMTFLAFFYTDVYRIPAATASVIIFAGGFVGAFFNVIMGIIADRTETRWGKFRPWILWTSVPFGVIALLAFSTPNFAMSGKIAYAMLTYFLLVLIYSANNLPYSALSGVITGDMKQRNSLSAYRFLAVTIAQFIIQSLLLPLVLIMGDGDKAEGFRSVMTLFAIAGIICFIITFLTTKERVRPPQTEKTSIIQDLKDLTQNRPWVIMLFLTILVFITLSLKGGMYIYYFKYYLDEASLSTFLEQIGFNAFISQLNGLLVHMGFAGFEWPEDAATSAFSLFNAGGILFTLVGIVFSKPLADRFGKRDIFGIFLFLAALCLAAFYFYAPQSIILVFLTQMLQGLFYGVTTPLLWAMIADVADYSEWKNNRRATAIVFSAMIFGLKVGLSIGGALVAGILSSYGYVAESAIQTADTVFGIRISVSLYAAAGFIIGAVLLLWYEIDRNKEQLIEKELNDRREI
ncbi:MFS transporter [Olivibacter sitiensis]|uniref:MFS transporter n=1 Tax=Olivibacter sitiensis TaxID=376470 RepID=UPI000409488B|nr:MFS transporter [Olivibacter sitiensis]